MVTYQQYSRDARMGEAHDAPAPLTLESGRRVAIFVSIAGKDDQIYPFLDGCVYDEIQRFEKIYHAHRQASLSVMPSMIGDIDMSVGKMEDGRHWFMA